MMERMNRDLLEEITLSNVSQEVRKLAANAFSLNDRKMNFQLLCKTLEDSSHRIESVTRTDVSAGEWDPDDISNVNNSNKAFFNIATKNNAVSQKMNLSD